MALWGTFLWSDGTLWADANGAITSFASEIDRKGYHVSAKISFTLQAPPGALAAFVLHTLSIETGVRSQLPQGAEAFIDRNDNTQRISIRVTSVSGDTENLTDETGDNLTDETGDPLVTVIGQVFIIDQLHLLTNRRSRVQPTG